MISEKRKSYRGRWLVKLLQAALVLGLIFFALDALGQWFNPTADTRLVLVQPQVTNQENTVQPILEEVRNSDAEFDSEDYFYMGLAHQDYSEYNEAILDYTRAIELNENFTDAFLNRGVAYEQLGQSRRALSDFDTFLMRDGMIISSFSTIDRSSNFTVEMSEAYRYDFPIELSVGQVLSVEVTSVEKDMTDPLILLVNEAGLAIAGNDDVLRDDGSFISMNSYIHSYEVVRSGTYTLFVSHAGGGSYGELAVTISIDN